MSRARTAPDPTDADLDRFDEIERLLDVTYGPRLLHPNGDPIGTLVGTILSQSTSDVNSGRAMQRLQEEFPTWQEVVDADPADVVEAIRSGGLANIKGPRIQQVLRSIIAHRGSLDIGFLTGMTVMEAMDWLVALDGVGPKTAACVLLFSLGMPAMPVDTHVGRVMTRLGVVPDRTSTLRKQHMLETLIGPHPQRVYAVHVETIAHGRAICTSRVPKCAICPLKDHCEYYETYIAPDPADDL